MTPMKPVFRFGLVFLVLLLTGALSRAWVRPAWKEVLDGQPVLNQESLGAAAGQGILLGLFGGFRSLLADMAWIQTSYFWLDKDWPKTETALRATTQLDPRPLYFWVQGARILAYDVSNWRIRELETSGQLQSEGQVDRIRAEQAYAGIDLLEQAMNYHKDNPRLFIEIAQIYHNILKQPLMAADYFGKAASSPQGPYFAGRLHAELLRRGGRPDLAYAFYTSWYPRLDPEDPFAMRPLVLSRIRNLEQELGIPAGNRFREP